MRCVQLSLVLVAATGSAALAQEAHVVSVSPDTAGLNGTINVVIDNLDAFLKPDSGKSPAVVPFLDGYPLKGSRLEYVDRNTRTLRFSLIRDPSDKTSRDSWNHVLGGIGPLARQYAFSVGKEGDAPLPKDPSKPVTFNLIVFPTLWSVIALLVLLVLLLTFIVLAVKTDMLKDPPAPGHARSYSLGRCQMAWWFFIVIASFTCIWLVTGDLVVPPSSLILLGISSATALSAVIVNPKPDKGTHASGFFNGLLNDGDGVSFHRFQMFGWTLILGIVFIRKVVNELAQPTLDATLLTLMGISSGTYIGFKFPEKTLEAREE